MSSFSYLKLKNGQRWALIYLAEGREPEDFIKDVPNQLTGQDGITMRTLDEWKWKFPHFKEAWKAILNDPTWARREIMQPMLLTQMFARELEYTTSRKGNVYKGSNAKKIELLMTASGDLEPKDNSSKALLTELMKAATLQATSQPKHQPLITVIDVEAEH